MKPVPFDYLAPTSVEEVLAALDEHGDQSCLLAGGQSLVPQLNFRIRRPAVVIDLNRVAELGGHDGTSGLGVGAMTRQEEVLGSADANARAPMLVAAVRHIGHQAIRTRGTIGGSLSHADPGSELPLAAVVLGAVMTVRRGGQLRRVGAEDFFTGRQRTCLGPDELLTGVEFPDMPVDAGWGFEEFSLRARHAPVVCAAAIVVRDDQGRVTEARIGIGGVGEVPHRALGAERAIIGHEVNASSVRDAAEAGAATLEPPTDVHGSGSFRRHLATVLVSRVLRRAAGQETQQ